MTIILKALERTVTELEQIAPGSAALAYARGVLDATAPTDIIKPARVNPFVPEIMEAVSLPKVSPIVKAYKRGDPISKIVLDHRVHTAGIYQELRKAGVKLRGRGRLNGGSHATQ